MSKISIKSHCGDHQSTAAHQLKSKQTMPAKSHDSSLVDAAVLRLVAHLSDNRQINIGAIFKRADVPDKAPTQASLKGTLLNVTAAAAYLDISPKTLANWRVSGKGPRFVKIGGRIAYKRSDLREFVATNLRLSTSDQGGNQS